MIICACLCSFLFYMFLRPWLCGKHTDRYGGLSCCFALSRRASQYSPLSLLKFLTFECKTRYSRCGSNCSCVVYDILTNWKMGRQGGHGVHSLGSMELWGVLGGHRNEEIPREMEHFVNTSKSEAPVLAQERRIVSSRVMRIAAIGMITEY